ncbi:MAG: phosphoribosylamine--glycine ligase [Gemmatimonadales bacterium]
MNVLVVGGGGREHALCWTLSHSATVFCTPGNPGTLTLGINLSIDINNHRAFIEAVRERSIDLVVVGPEAPLADGLVDALDAAEIPAFGPTRAAAQLEASKAFAKSVMLTAGVPTANSETFADAAKALDYVSGHSEPLVVKASGLAAGKGVIICETREQAANAVREMFGGRFGSAGHEVIVETYLEGEELSVFAMTDGEHTMLLPSAQDHKRLGEEDTGPNTGGMGAYTPVSIASDALLSRATNEVLMPTLRQMASDGRPFRGMLYAGLMIDPSGTPFVLEFNCRFGDPETQVVLPAAGDIDLAAHMFAIAKGETWDAPSRVDATQAAVTTVVAASGYPASPVKGAAIDVPSTLPQDTILFHAGTKLDEQGTLRASGGRVLCATGLGGSVAEAAERSRELAEAVAFENAFFRRDIAWREVARAGAT